MGWQTGSHPCVPVLVCKLLGDRSSFVWDLPLCISSSGCWFISFNILCNKPVIQWVNWFPEALIYISLMMYEVDHLSMYLLAVCIFPLEKHLFRSFAHFWVRCFIVELQEFFIYSGYELIRYMICKFFSPSVGCLFTLLIVSFDVRNFTSGCGSNYFSFRCLNVWCHLSMGF